MCFRLFRVILLGFAFVILTIKRINFDMYLKINKGINEISLKSMRNILKVIE